MCLPAFISNHLRQLLALLALTLGVTVSHGQIFISNFSTGTIGEYNFDGTAVNSQLISGLSGPWSLAASSNNLFVATQSTGTVAKYNFDGTVVNTSLITGLDRPNGVAVFGSDLFVSFVDSGYISLYTLEGVPLNTLLVSGLGQLSGITVVTAIPEPASYAALFGASILSLTFLRRFPRIGCAPKVSELPTLASP